MTTRCAACCLSWALNRLTLGLWPAWGPTACVRCRLLRYRRQGIGLRSYRASRMRVAVICFRRAVRFSLWHAAQALLRLVEMLS